MSTDTALLHRFYHDVTHDGLLDRDPEARAAIVAGVHALSNERACGQAGLRVFNPNHEEDGWVSRFTAIQICTDDMPFLVDSVLGELDKQDLTVRLFAHPQVVVQHDNGQTTVQDREHTAARPDDTVESWMHLEIDRLPQEEERTNLAERLRKVLSDVRKAIEDWPAMREQIRTVTQNLEHQAPPTVDEGTVESTLRFLRWLEDDHFTFLGYREYDLETTDGEDALVSVPGTGLGILRDEGQAQRRVSRLRPEAQATAREPHVLTITKANSRSTVHRNVYLDYLGLRRFDEQGNVIGERRILGLFTKRAYFGSVYEVPIISDKVDEILTASGFGPASHSGRDLVAVLEDFPRDELFQATPATLSQIITAVVHLHDRPRTRLFVRKDEFGRFVTALIYLPRDRFNTELRYRMQQMLLEAYGAETVDAQSRVGESSLAHIYYTLRMHRGGAIPDVDTQVLEQQLAETSRTWQEELARVVEEHFTDQDTIGEVLAQYAHAFPESYKADFDAATALADLQLIHRLITGDVQLPLRLYAEADHAPGERRLKIYRDAKTSLTDVLPIFTNLGMHVTDERPYTLTTRDGTICYVYDFGIRAESEELWHPVDRDPQEVAEAFEEIVATVWSGQVESDALNSLVLKAGLSWQQVVILRTYLRYLRQIGVFSLDYLEDGLVANPTIAGMLVDLFEARFDPEASGDRDSTCAEITAQIETALDEVTSLDEDRIVRAILSMINATLRTNAFQRLADGTPKDRVSLKLSPQHIDLLPEPRPAYEIWVYSPRVEGSHLRFGAVARGGLRWSDRRQDFRTEVLGLVKAQLVKNAIIVPTGSKGGFVAKQLPDPSQDRSAWQAEGVAAYQTFIRGMLDITDNRDGGEIVAPQQVVRHDGDDSYLVVAADKGTASFSDVANDVARDYGFWLDDAFASGGSSGYDHKAMGITARGAWESVKRHFRELGLDTQTEDFTAVGIGDMSGDVFGNGMLRSGHIRLVAAFDHRHVFLDPEPDAETSYAERLRLFELPGSTWGDYNTDLISEGGGVYARTEKSVPISPQVRRALGMSDEVEQLTPAEVISAVLKAPVDLLWNGGVGTYVKASEESHAETGDRSNDSIRVDGIRLRTRVVGEGGNLGFTQRGRVEAARNGVQINTDAIDNSAGVDSSDFEVNIKIALRPLVTNGELDMPARDELLSEMTEEVANRVLRDNYEQNKLIGIARHQGSVMAPVHERLMRYLVSEAGLDRELEALPDREEMAERIHTGEGLCSPEYAVLVAYAKLALKDPLLDSGLPEDEFFTTTLQGYFPTQMQERFAPALLDHPLSRDIIANGLANQMVNNSGVTFAFRAADETGATMAQVARAYVVCSEVFGLHDFVEQVEGLDTEVSAEMQSELYLEQRRLLDRSVRWFLNNRSLRTQMHTEIAEFAEPVAHIVPKIDSLLRGREAEHWRAKRDEAAGAGVAAHIAERYASLVSSYAMLDIVEIAEETDHDVEAVARMYFLASERFGIEELLDLATELDREDRWDSLARGAVRDDLYSVLRELCHTLVVATDDAAEPEARIEEWVQDHEDSMARTSQVLDRIGRLSQPGLAPLSVALRTLRGLVRQGALA